MDAAELQTHVQQTILDMAARQDAFAGAEYTQHTESDRTAYQHAATILRLAAQRLAPTDAGSPRGLDNVALCQQDDPAN